MNASYLLYKEFIMLFWENEGTSILMILLADNEILIVEREFVVWLVV